MKINIERIVCTGLLTMELEVPSGTAVREAIAKAGTEITDQWLFVNGNLATPDVVLLPDAELSITEPLMGG